MTSKQSTLQPHGLRSLRAYQLARQLAHLVYEASGKFPRGEYRLVGQMRGAGALIRSLRQKKLDGTWDRGQTLRENEELYNV